MILRDVAMVSHGRLARVMLSLVAAMTAGALVLLALEGKPIKPMAFSLSSQTQLTSIPSALGTEAGVELRRWRRIEVSYHPSHTPLSARYGLAGDLATNYHFVIGNGLAGGDGQIFASTAWTKQRLCRVNANSTEGRGTIRITLIGDGPSPRSTPRQARQLESLVSSLVRTCQIEPKITWKNP
jgi:hypothetical protein